MYERLLDFAILILKLFGAGVAAAVVGFIFIGLSERYARSHRDRL